MQTKPICDILKSQRYHRHWSACDEQDTGLKGFLNTYIWLDQKLTFKSSHINTHVSKLRQKNWLNRTTFPMFCRKQIIDHWFIIGGCYSTHHCILYEKVGWAPFIVRRDSHGFLLQCSIHLEHSIMNINLDKVKPMVSLRLWLQPTQHLNVTFF